ncbi:MAG: alpha/beta hydrolase [Desulfobacteraceae bacterium]|nr:MAG: alpha/beta hydrolase [Desulfobacteraceae bacterium]
MLAKIAKMNIPNIFLLPILIIFILAVIIFYQQLENSIIFYPDKALDDRPSNWDLCYKDIQFLTPDGQKLHGWFFPVSGKSPVLLFCHGNAGNISHRIENIKFLVKRDISVFIFDYRGYGQSSGRPSEKGIYIDGIAAYDYLTNIEKISPDRIVIFGRSIGGAVAIEVALQRKVRCLIIESTFTSTKDMAKTIFPFFIVSPFLPHHYNNILKIADVSVPKLIIHGEDDNIVPFSMGNKLFAQATEPKLFLPIHGAGHNDTYVVGGEDYFEAIVNFILSSTSVRAR